MSRKRFLLFMFLIMFNWICYLGRPYKSSPQEKSILYEKEKTQTQSCHIPKKVFNISTNKTTLPLSNMIGSVQGTAPTQSKVSIIRDCKYWTLPEEWINSNLTLRILDIQLDLKDCTASSDVAANLEIRRFTLERECKYLGVKDTYLAFNWTWQPLRYNGSLYLDVRKNVRVCLIPKGGSTTWHKNRPLLMKEKLETNKMISVLPARHPFTRLVSVYNDLFCHGKLFTCADGGDGARFDGFLYGLWIPILISSGRLEMNQAFSNEIYHIYPIKGYSYRRKTALGNMANMELKNAVENCYSTSKRNILDKYKGVIISFEDFINHIFWTYEHGIADHTWNPESNLCDACRKSYTHILHLENYDEEIPYLFKTIGFKNTHDFPAHNVRSKDGTAEFINYYYDLPLSMIVRLVKFYHYDFKLLGYSL